MIRLGSVVLGVGVGGQCWGSVWGSVLGVGIEVLGGGGWGCTSAFVIITNTLWSDELSSV